MTIDKIGEKVKGGLRSTIEMNELPLDVLKEKFKTCDSGSQIELSIIKSILNNPKTTPEDLDYYFFEVQEGSEAELQVAKALITHPNLTQKLFDKNYGMAMQKGGEVFDLFEIADQERSKKAKKNKEKMENTMQGTILKKLSGSGIGSIRGNDGKNYYFEFIDINDKDREEDRSMIFNELSKNSKVEFKLKPNKGTKKEEDAQYLDIVLGGYIERDFTATDIVVKS